MAKQESEWENEGGWIYEPPKRHACTTPAYRDFKDKPVESIWVCGECGLYWQLKWENKKKVFQRVADETAEALVKGQRGGQTED